jgi:hypothetical protein
MANSTRKQRMSVDHYMSEEREEPAPTELMDSEVFTEETTPVEKTTPVEEMTPVEKMIPLEESPVTVHEEKLQKQDREIEKAQEKSSFRKRKQKKRTITYLTQILKQAEKNRDEINKLTMLIQSLQKQTKLAAAGQSQLLKQVQSQLSQLQKQVTRTQKDVQKMKMTPSTKTRMRKSATRPRSKKSKSITSTRVRRRTEKK